MAEGEARVCGGSGQDSGVCDAKDHGYAGVRQYLDMVAGGFAALCASSREGLLRFDVMFDLS